MHCWLLWAFVAVCGLLSSVAPLASEHGLSRLMLGSARLWDLLGPEMELGVPCSGRQILNHWTQQGG